MGTGDTRPTTGQVDVRSDGVGERPPWLLYFICVIVMLIPYDRVLPVPWTGVAFPARATGLVMAFLVVLGFLRPRQNPVKSANLGVVAVLVYMLTIFLLWGIGLIHVGTPMQEGNKRTIVIVVVGAVGVAIYTALRVRATRQLSIALGCLFVCGVLSAMLALLQHFAHINTAEMYGQLGLRPTTSAVRVLRVRAGAVRAVGTFGHAIPFSVATAAMVPIALHFSRYAHKKGIRRLSAGGAMVLLVAVPTGVSRAGIVALAVAVVAYSLSISANRVVTGFLVFVVGVGVYAALAPSTFDALIQTISNSGTDSSVQVRLQQQSSALKIFEHNPIFGIGPGAVTNDISGQYPIDNQWFSALMEGGILGGGVQALVAGFGILGAVRALRVASTAGARSRVYAMTGAYLALLSESVSSDFLSNVQTQMLFFLFYGLLWTGYAGSDESDGPARENAIPGIACSQLA